MRHAQLDLQNRHAFHRWSTGECAPARCAEDRRETPHLIHTVLGATREVVAKPAIRAPSHRQTGPIRSIFFGFLTYWVHFSRGAPRPCAARRPYILSPLHEQACLYPCHPSRASDWLLGPPFVRDTRFTAPLGFHCWQGWLGSPPPHPASPVASLPPGLFGQRPLVVVSSSLVVDRPLSRALLAGGPSLACPQDHRAPPSRARALPSRPTSSLTVR